MVKFTPIELQENVNVSKISPIKELFVLLGASLAIILSIYLALGITLDIIINQIPHKAESSLSKLINLTEFQTDESMVSTQRDVQALLDSLVALMPENNMKYKVTIFHSDDVNALALPGGNIVVFSGLLKTVESENELAMVLGHELGHFYYKDHIRGLGRGIVFVIMSSILFGSTNDFTNLLSSAMMTMELKFSREQESAADEFGLYLLNAKYGHTGGSTDFFHKLHQQIELPEFLGFLTSHPVNAERVRNLSQLNDKFGYRPGPKNALFPSIQAIKDFRPINP